MYYTLEVLPSFEHLNYNMDRCFSFQGIFCISYLGYQILQHLDFNFLFLLNQTNKGLEASKLEMMNFRAFIRLL